MQKTGAFPLAKPSVAMDKLQRQPASENGERGGAAAKKTVQRAIEDGATIDNERVAESIEPEPQPDLDNLARQVYPLIKRMLAIERERLSRWNQ